MYHELPPKKDRALGHTLSENVVDPDNEKVIAEEGRVIDESLANKISDTLGRNAEVHVKSFASDEIEYMPADVEDKHTIVQANAQLNDRG